MPCAGSPPGSSRCAEGSSASATRATSCVRLVDLQVTLSPAQRRDHLTAAQYVHLIGFVSQDPELWNAWRLVHVLNGVDQAGTEAEEAARIEGFVHKWAELPLTKFKTVLKVLAKWLPEVLAFHREDLIMNGRLEDSITSSACSSESLTASSTRTTSGKSDAVVPSRAIITGLSVGVISHEIAGNHVIQALSE